MKNFHDLLKEFNPHLKNDLNKNFILSAKNSHTYHSIIQSCNHSAEMLKEVGVEKNSLVPILMDNSPDFILAVFSLWMIEAIPVPINVKLSINEIENQIVFLRNKIILVDNNFRDKIKIKDVQEILFEGSKQNQGTELELNFDDKNTAVVLFTSGSSGKPKAVELTFNSLINSAKIQNTYLQQNENDRWLASLPFYHIGGFSIIFRALMYGAQIVLPEDLKTKSLHSSIQSFNPTLISLVSSQLSELLKNNIQPNKDFRHVLLGGGFIDSNLMKEALSKGWNVSKVYGSTETTSFVTVLSAEEFKLKPESAGKPVPPNDILIVDEHGNELPIGSEGEIVVKSPAIMNGYLNDEETTKQKLKSGLYFSGDFGYKDKDGFLFVIKRRSDLIVTGGENVNPIEIEESILKFYKVKEVCVLGIDDEKWGQKIIAAIVSNPNQMFTLEELRDFLKNKIAAFKIPKEIFFVDELPKTELGKVRRDNIKTDFLA